MNKEIWLCDLEKCKLYLNNPVTLPCGYTICHEHLDGNQALLNCRLCNQDHVISELKIDAKLTRLIELNFHLSGLHLQAKQLLDRIKLSISHFEQTILADTSKFIKAFFDHKLKSIGLKEQKHLKQLQNATLTDPIKQDEIKELSRDLNEKSNKMMLELIDFQNECEKNNEFKEAFNPYKKTDNGVEEEFFINECEHDLFRRPNLSDEELKTTIKRLNLILNKLEARFHTFKTELLMKQNVHRRNIFSLNKANLNVSFDMGALRRTMRDPFMDHFEIGPDHIHALLVIDSMNVLITGSGDATHEYVHSKRPHKKDDYRIKVWNLLNGQLVRTIIGAHRSRITAIVDQCELNRFLTCSIDGSIKIWDLFSHRMVTKIKLDPSNKITRFEWQILKACLLPNHQLAMFYRNGNIIIFDLMEAREIKKIKAFKNLIETQVCLEKINFELSKDSSKLFCSDSNGSIKIWDARNFNLINSHEDMGLSFTITPNGEKMVLTSKDDERLIKIWTLSNQTCESFRVSNKIGHSIRALTNNLIAIATETNNQDGISCRFKINIYDIDEMREVKCLNAHMDQINSMTSNGHFLFTGSSDQSIKIWKI